MGKIVFLDIDGTILDSNKRILDSTKEAVRLLKDNGVYVAIATGRAPFMFKEIREELEIDTYIALNGQMVVVDGKPIYQYRMPISVLENLTVKSKEMGHPLVHMAVDKMVANVEYDRNIEVAIKSLQMDHPPYDPDFYKNAEIAQVLLFCTEGEEKAYEKDFPDFRFVRWHELAVDVIVRDGSKAAGIRKTIDYLGFSIQDTYAFGDGLNDMEMLKEVGTGVAMGNAHPLLKKVADKVTKSSDDNGIYYGFKSLGLI